MMAPLPREDHRGRPASAGGVRKCDRHHPGGDGGCCVGAGVPPTGDRHDCASCLGRPMERWCMRRRRRGQALAPAAGAAPSAVGHGGPPCGKSAAFGGPSGCERCLLGMDYAHEQDDGCNDQNSCDNISSYGEGATSSLPIRLPRSRICGDDGPSEGGGPPDALRGAAQDAWPSLAPLFLSADHRTRVTVTSSGRTGDGAAVHFPGKGRLPGSGAIDNLPADDAVGFRSTGCGERGKRVRCSDGGTSRALLLLVSLLWLSLGALLVDGASASIMGDGCDWSGSGLMAEMEVSREGGGVGVRPVYLRCSQGAVSWAYPRGALRVLLRLAGGGVDGEFRGCVRLGRTWKGARLFLEGPRSLHPLFPPGVEDGAAEHSRGSGVRCFQSRKGQAALYVEATPGGVSPRGRTVASFEYHLQPLPSGVKSFDPSEECRPCTVEEMTHAFCSSDLVTRGTIRSVESHDDPETSELKVRVTKLIRRTRAPPPALEGDPFDEGELQEEEAAVGDGPARAGRHWWDSADRGASVTLHVPTHCGARHGAGEFVFMAQRKLGQLRLRCAPRLEDWAELTRKTHRLAASPCVLQA